MVWTAGIRKVKLRLWRGHITILNIMVTVWIGIWWRPICGRGVIWGLNMSNGGFFGPYVFVVRICVDVSYDWSGGTGERGWTVAIRGTICNWPRGGRRYFRGGGRRCVWVRYLRLLGWGALRNIAITFKDFFRGNFRGVAEEG